MLKCKQPLGLVYDDEIKDFLKKRGGICFAGSKRYAKANNKYMKNYDENTIKDTVSVLYCTHIIG